MYISMRPGALAPHQDESTGDVDTSTPRGQGVGTTVVLLGLTSMFTDISAEMVVAVLPLFATAVLGLGPLAYGAIEGLYQGTTALVRLAGGFAGDRSGRPKAVASVGYGLSALCKLALLPVSGAPALAAVLSADRFGKGLRTAPRDAMIAAASDPAHLGRAFGVHRALDTAGALIGPLLAFAVLAAIPGGYSTIFLLSFAIALVGLAVLVLLVPADRPAGVRQGRTRASASGVAGLFADRSLRRLLTGAALLSLLTVADGFLYLALLHRGTLSATYFPLLLVGTATVYMLLAVPLGRLSDRIGRTRVFVAGHLALAMSYLVAAGAVGGLLGLCTCLLLLGTYYAATDGVLAAAASALVPAHLRGSGIALAQTAVAGGRLVAALAFGTAWTLVGRDGALVGFAVVLLVVAPCAALLLRTPRT